MKSSFFALALAGCAVAVSAWVVRDSARRAKALLHQEALSRWEDDGGPAVPVARAAQPR